MRIALLFALLVFNLYRGSQLYAQETVVWASGVIAVSSDYSTFQYSAIQALFKPNVYPSGGGNPNAWRPKKSDLFEYIVVEFDKPIRAQQIAIAETENPGAISRIYAYDDEDNEYLIIDVPPRPINLKSRLLNLFFTKTDYEIRMIRIELEGAAVPGFNSIDAIGLSSSNLPIDVMITLAKNVNQKADVDKLGNNVNSNYKENAPLLSPNGKRLYFSRQYHPENVGGLEDSEDIWYSEFDENSGLWLPAKNLGAPLNTPGPNFISSIIPGENGETLLLGNQYGRNGRMYAGVSKSTWNGEDWSQPENIYIENDYNYSPKSDYYMDKEQTILIMSVERDDTYGERDLYVSFKKEENTWSEPKNLGPDLNTTAEESSPFLGTDGRTLYFSSSGYSGYGGSDIYVSRRLDASWLNWSEPENLGAAINSRGEDTYFNMPSAGEHIYFTRSSDEKNADVFRLRKDDFYVDDKKPTTLLASAKTKENRAVSETKKIESLKPANVAGEEVGKAKASLPDGPNPADYLVTINGRVLNTSSMKPVPARILVERLPDGLKIGEYEVNDRKGNYSIKVRGGARYGLSANINGFLSVNENFDFNKVRSNKSVTKDLLLVPIAVGQSFVLNNIFFEFDTHILKTASYAELDRVLGLMKANAVKKIEIAGHTDSTGSADYNKWLSEQRAKSVAQYFLTNNIDAGRIIVKGYGEEFPSVPNNSASNKQKNRRVEFKILAN